MTNHIYKSITEPIRENPSFHQRWKENDCGLIICWETGRLKNKSNPELSSRALRGELPVLGWKGGIDKVTLKKEKYGTLNYLAQWHGLRNEDLDIDTSKEYILTCSRTKIRVIFTGSQDKYLES